MNIFSNHKSFGGDFGKEFTQNLKTFNTLHIASGYFGSSVITSLKPELLNIAQRGFCKILIGMIFNEGVSSDQKSKLEELDNELRAINSDSGVFVSLSQYHGKIYKFTNPSEEKIYVGSSNFSDSGFKNNYEFNALIIDQITKQSVSHFLDYFFDESNHLSAPLNDVVLTIKGNKNVKSVEDLTSDLKNFIIPESTFPIKSITSNIRIKLRVDEQPNSSLNLFFDKGRKNILGKYVTRPWYEVEVTSTSTERLQTDFPFGEFTAYIRNTSNNKFYKIPMITASANNKALTTKDNRELLGEIIKGKLESLGFLNRNERVTSETLSNYGKDYIELKKFDEGKYYFEF